MGIEVSTQAKGIGTNFKICGMLYIFVTKGIIKAMALKETRVVE